MKKSEFKEKIRLLAKDIYAEKTDQPKLAPNKFPMIDSFPSLKGVMDDLFDFQYEPFVKDIQWVAPKPTTFRVMLVNGADFYLIYEGDEAGKGLYTANVSGKKYWLASLSEEQQACEAISRLLRYQFATVPKDEELDEPIGGDPIGGGESEDISVDIEPAVPASVEDL